MYVKGATLKDHIDICTTLCNELENGATVDEAKLLYSRMKQELASKMREKAENPDGTQ